MPGLKFTSTTDQLCDFGLRSSLVPPGENKCCVITPNNGHFKPGVVIHKVPLKEEELSASPGTAGSNREEGCPSLGGARPKDTVVGTVSS